MRLNLFEEEVVSLITKEIQDTQQELSLPNQVSKQDIQALLTTPPQFELGQAALPCFPFAKTWKKSPPVIAQMLCERLQGREKHVVARVEHINGYLNFYANFENLFTQLNTVFEAGEFFKKPFKNPEKPEKIVVEYSQPNTHKALHVGHLRGLVLGDAVCHLLEYAGHQVVRATYPGDLGAHVAKLLWYITMPQPKPLPMDHKIQWLGTMYAKADEAFKQLQGTPEETAAKSFFATIINQITSKNGPYYDLWHETRQWCLDNLQDVYTWLGSHFDVWYFESTCDEPSKELVKKKWEEGFFVSDQGAIGIDLSAWNLGFAMYLKSDGHGLYLTKDLDLIAQKFADPAVTKSIYVVDARQKLHFAQLFKTAELMGYPQAKQSVHLSYETVNTEQGLPFSSRDLNGLALLDLRNRMEEQVKSLYLNRYAQEWSPLDIQRTAQMVTIGALKYGMLRVDNNTQIHFSLSEWLRLDGDTGPYLQYVYARCGRILEKAEPAAPCAPQLTSNEERLLLFGVLRFHDHALQAAQQYRPSLLATYLYDLAKQFNRFYEHCPIRDSTEPVRYTRLALVRMARQAIAFGLGLMGIPTPERM